MNETETGCPPLEPLRRDPAADPAALARLRTALSREASAYRRSHIALTPASALLAAVLVALVTSAFWLIGLRSISDEAGRSERTPVQFVFVAGDADRVALVGDFNDWDRDATPMTRSRGGVWSVTIPLETGRFAYAFLVDGAEWRADPSGVPAHGDFGRPSSVVFVNSGEADL
jgi:hypothetical protein